MKNKRLNRGIFRKLKRLGVLRNSAVYTVICTHRNECKIWTNGSCNCTPEIEIELLGYRPEKQTI